LQHLFSVWQELSRRLKAAGHVLLLCDYDGTLAPIVERPELADLPEKTRQLLRELVLQGHLTLGIISGRALADLKQRVNIDGIIYAGNHGLEIEGPGIGIVIPLAEEMRPVFHLIYQVLSKAMAPIRGVFVENKGLTISVHYRMVEESKSEEVSNIFEKVIATARSLGKVRITHGKKVYEVRPPVDWDKDKATSLIIDKFGKKKMKNEFLPIFLGDDQTDEDGFKVVEKYKGISVFVGEKTGDSTARYYLKSPAEVEQFLSLLLQPNSRGNQ
jgi:trehalose 6-phosphate phosphatase